jgi:hypothetical protein
MTDREQPENMSDGFGLEKGVRDAKHCRGIVDAGRSVSLVGFRECIEKAVIFRNVKHSYDG